MLAFPQRAESLQTMRREVAQEMSYHTSMRLKSNCIGPSRCIELDRVGEVELDGPLDWLDRQWILTAKGPTGVSHWTKGRPYSATARCLVCGFESLDDTSRPPK